MTGLSHGANLAIARIPVEDYRTFVDVGAAQGDLAVQVALANPHLTGIGFDLPVVSRCSRSRRQARRRRAWRSRR